MTCISILILFIKAKLKCQRSIVERFKKVHSRKSSKRDHARNVLIVRPMTYDVLIKST